MDRKIIAIDGKEIVLEEVAQNGNCKLFRYESDDRICGAPIKEVVEKFPDYRPSREDLTCDYLLEENGTLIVYNPDGSVADPFELITEEEINHI